MERQSTMRRTEPAGAAALSKLDYMVVYRAEPRERIALVRKGVSAAQAKAMVKDLDASNEWITRSLNIPTSSLNRKAKAAQPLSPDEGERFLGLARLVGQVQAMVEEFGEPEGFDARAWTMRWLSEPLPAFDGACPMDFMDTMEGQGLVARALTQIQTGAYA